MAFNKLVLVFVLFSLSFGFRFPFGKSKKIDKSNAYDPTVLYCDDEQIELDDIVYVDYTKIDYDTSYTGKRKITDFIPFNGTATVDDNFFYTFPVDEDFANLKTSELLNTACEQVEQSHPEYIYGLYGYAVYAITGKDIAPSLTTLLANLPTRITYSNVPPAEEDDYPDIKKEELTDCSDGWGRYYLSYSIQKYGIIGADCIPNTTPLPTNTLECSSGATGVFDPQLKGYQEGIFTYVSATAVKDLLIRFGPLYYYQGNNEGIIIGWSGNNWVTAIEDESTYRYKILSVPIEQSGTYSGILLFSLAALNPDCTGDDIPFTAQCKCGEGNTTCLEADAKARYDSLSTCTATTGEEQIDCKCAAGLAPKGCICPLDNEGDYTKTQCEAEKAYGALDTCTRNTGSSVLEGACKCASGKAPQGCVCPLDNLGDYTQTACIEELYNALPTCTASTGGFVFEDTCKCAAEKAPEGCNCPLNDDGSYTKTQCEAEKEYGDLSYCSAQTGESQDNCKCETRYAPKGCTCPPSYFAGSYTKEDCEAEKFAAIPTCTAATGEEQTDCKCAAGFAPIGCICPLDDEGDYTKAQCEKEKLCFVLTGKTEAQCPCIDEDPRAICKICTAKDTPSAECKCPTSTTGDYTKEQCETDKAQTVDCAKPSIDTQKEVCPCPTDKSSQQYKDDPRTVGKGICASGLVRITLGMIAVAVVLPALTLLW